MAAILENEELKNRPLMAGDPDLDVDDDDVNF